MLKKAIILSALLYTGASQASLLTSTSGLGLDVTTVGASTVGGIVVDLFGTNGTHVVSQLAASSLFVGFFAGDPGTVGTQTGFSAGILSSLGGGLAGASIRFTLYDGDTASGNFDFNDNTLLINGLDFGNWSGVNAEQTDGAGTAIGVQSGGGFRDNILDTGWFTSSDNTLMTSLFNTLVATNELVFQIQDVDAGDNYFDFTQGIDQGLIDVGQGPVTRPNPNDVPEPAPLALMGLGMLAMLRLRRKK